jgi:aminoglycoside phosphotransferase (APT) family kinase protein
VIPDFSTLRPRFIELLVKSGNFSGAEQREAVLKMFSAQGYEWSFLCPMNREKRALLVPSSWSMTPLLLSDHFAELVVWDPEPRRAELLRNFYTSLDLRVHVIADSLRCLADRSERYSVVALEDSLATSTSGLHDDIVKCIVRLLEPDGQCCVVTANRLGVSRLRSSELNWGQRLTQLMEYRQSLPTVDGLRRRIRNASLATQRSYFFYPDHREPREILGWNRALPSRFSSGFFRWLDRIGLLARVHDGFMVVAGHEQLAPSFVEQLMICLGEELGLKAVPKVDQCRVQRTGVLLFFTDLADEGTGVLRVPLRQEGVTRIESSRRVMALLAERAPQICSVAPEQLAAGELLDRPYTLERKITGVTAAEIIGKSGTAVHVLEGALQFLCALGKVHTVVRQIDDRFLADHIKPVFSLLRQHHQQLSSDFHEVETALIRNTAGHEIPLIWRHGDFNVNNVLFHPTNIDVAGVVDWEEGRALGLPLQDLLHFILSVHRQRHGWSIGQAVIRALEGRLLDIDEQSAIERYCDKLALSQALFVPLLVMHWAEHACSLSKKAGSLLTQKWLEENLFMPLDKIRCLVQ